MDRRSFSKLTLTSSLAMAVIPKISMANSIKKQHVRLGGPVLKKYNSPEEWIQNLQHLGYTTASCPVKIGADSNSILAYKDAARKADIIISEVGAWSNPIDPDEEKAKVAIEKCIKSLELADEIGACSCVNVSGSRNPEKWAGPHKDNLTSDTFDLIVELTRKIIDAVKPQHTFFTLEAMPWSYPDSVNSYLKLIKAIDRKRFAVHFDPVNLVVSPQLYFNNGAMIKEAFQKLGGHLKSCHAKDIHLSDEVYTPILTELRPGLGNLNYKVFLTELAKLNDVPLMMEHLKTTEEYQLAANYIRKTGAALNIEI